MRILFFLILFSALSYAFDCLSLKGMEPVAEAPYVKGVFDDFEWRLSLPQTDVAECEWAMCPDCYGRFGPCPLTYPSVVYPKGVDAVRWSQKRVVRAAENLLGLPYKHRHIPALGGLDCSNFTAWIYNFALGLRISSNIQTQSVSAGHLLEEGAAFREGDLLFFWNKSYTRISHVGVYVGDGQMIHSSRTLGVSYESLSEFRKGRLAWGRRVLK